MIHLTRTCSSTPTTQVSRSTRKCDGGWTGTIQVSCEDGVTTTSSVIDVRPAQALAAAVTDDTLTIELTDGRSVSVPLAWFPRLAHGTHAERARWEVIGDGEGIHWPDLDEDISVEGLLLGLPSAESQSSLQRWLSSRSC